MRIHKEGVKIIPIAFFFIAVIDAVIYVLLRDYLIFYFLMAASIILAGLIVFFFREPFRLIDANENHILAPADGDVVEIIDRVFVKDYFNDDRLQVSIFMSPLNVHQNRAPVSGEVVYENHQSGIHYPAFVKKSSEKNERNSVVFRMKSGTEIMARQIAGIMARRIVSYKKPGDFVEQGNEYGFIRFGSRVDLFLPLNTKIKVKLHESTVGGKTIIATFK